MKHLIDLKILTPQKIVYADFVSEIVLPTESGEITVLPTHAPVVTIAKMGEVRIKKEEGNVVPFYISGGIVEIRPSETENQKQTEVIILAFDSEKANDIDIERAQKAYERAQKAMEESQNMQNVDFAKLQSAIDRELNKIQIAKKWRK